MNTTSTPQEEEPKVSNWKYTCIKWGAIILSFLGVISAAICSSYNIKFDGGLGGALAVALSFLILFTRENYFERAHKAVLGISQGDIAAELARANDQIPGCCETCRSLSVEIRLIKGKLLEADSSQKEQNRALTISSCFGTIFWGFGSIFSVWWSPVILFLYHAVLVACNFYYSILHKSFYG